MRYWPIDDTIDNTWVFALNYAAAHGLAIGRDVVWTTGPLGYLVFPQDIGANLAHALGVLQAKYQDDNDPALRFIYLLQTALACERAHVADRYGRSPNNASIWGWQRPPSGRKWTPQGTRIGWLSGTELFLDPATSYRIARELCGTERFIESEQALRHRLRERGLLASVDQGRGMVQVRRTLEGSARQVLHLKARDLMAPETTNKSPTLHLSDLSGFPNTSALK